MGVGDWFKTFCGELTVKDQGSISTRYKNITKRLNTEYWDTTSETSHSRYVGSFGRNTAVDPFSDLDMIFELPSEIYFKYDAYTSNGQSALLQAVKTSIDKTYSSTKIRADGQVIQVLFSGGATFEVVPVFNNKGGTYTFPDANGGGSWRTTDPLPEIKAIRDRNSVCNNNLIPLCRMARAWKSKWDVPIGGLLIDTFAYQFIDGFAHKDKSFFYYDFMCRDFFEWVGNQSITQEFWRAPGSGQYVYKKGSFQSKAKKCFELAKEAISHEMADPSRVYSAKSKWRDIFGTKFPS